MLNNTSLCNSGILSYGDLGYSRVRPKLNPTFLSLEVYDLNSLLSHRKIIILLHHKKQKTIEIQ